MTRRWLILLTCLLVAAYVVGACGTSNRPATTRPHATRPVQETRGSGDALRPARTERTAPTSAPSAVANAPTPVPHPRATAPIGLSDAELKAAAQRAFSSINIDASNIEIADGRAKGGERVLLVGFRTNARGYDLLPEFVKVLEMGYAMNSKAAVPIDSTIAIAGDAAGNLLSTATATAMDAGRATRQDISMRDYLATWTWGPGWTP